MSAISPSWAGIRPGAAARARAFPRRIRRSTISCGARMRDVIGFDAEQAPCGSCRRIEKRCRHARTSMAHPYLPAPRWRASVPARLHGGSSKGWPERHERTNQELLGPSSRRLKLPTFLRPNTPSRPANAGRGASTHRRVTLFAPKGRRSPIWPAVPPAWSTLRSASWRIQFRRQKDSPTLQSEAIDQQDRFLTPLLARSLRPTSSA